MTHYGAVNLQAILGRIGRNELVRTRFIAACQLVESLPENATTPREELTGPIVDALHQHAGVLHKELSNGIAFDFYYRSRIGRDFVMSIPEKPDHVWEPQTTKLLLHLAKGAANVLVGGAYFGDHAILLANQLREGGVCHAFEPDSDQAEMLEHNARINKLSNVRVKAAALWSDSTTRLQLSGADALAGAVPAAQPDALNPDLQVTFPAVTIDEYLREQNIDRIELIMLDLEGGELAALRGAQTQLSLPLNTAPHIVFEMHRSYVDWTGGLENTDICKYLRAFGYTLFAVRDFQSNLDMRGFPVELVPAEVTYLAGPPHGFNMLAVKDTTIIDRWFKLCAGVSPKLLLHRDPRLHHPTVGRRMLKHFV